MERQRGRIDRRLFMDTQVEKEDNEMGVTNIERLEYKVGD